MKWYLAGFAGIGLLTGLFVGMSESPVVATALPLLFSLVVGTGGVYLAKGDIHSEGGRERFKLIGVALVAFTMSCLVASLYGISVRTGASLRALFVAEPLDGEMAPLPLRQDVDASQSLRLATIRAELTAIGVTAKEQASLLEKLVGLPPPDGAIRLGVDPQEVLVLTTALTTALDKALDGNRNKQADSLGLVPQLHYILTGTTTLLRSYISAPVAVKSRKFDGYMDLVKTIHDTLEETTKDKDALRWLREHDISFDLLAEVGNSTMVTARRQTMDSEQSDSPEEQLFQLVKVLNLDEQSIPTTGDPASTRRTLSRRVAFKH